MCVDVFTLYSIGISSVTLAKPEYLLYEAPPGAQTLGAKKASLGQRVTIPLPFFSSNFCHGIYP